MRQRRTDRGDEHLRSAIYNLVDDHDVERDSPLLAGLTLILDTLADGKDVTIIAEPLPQPATG